MGVQESRICVGSDWGWLYSQRHDLRGWAADFWRRLGVDPERPLLVANVVNMIWRTEQPKANTAEGIDKAASRFGLQVAFFCNECREGEFFDFAAAQELAARLKTPSRVVPNNYYSPDEALALLNYATVTVAQRYHFILQTVLSNSVPVAILRGEKMRGLAAELQIPVAGSIDKVDPNALVGAIENALENRGHFLRSLTQIRRQLTNRAGKNLSFIQQLPPYSGFAYSV